MTQIIVMFQEVTISTQLSRSENRPVTRLRLLLVLLAGVASSAGCELAKDAVNCTAVAVWPENNTKWRPADTVDVVARAETEPVSNACDAADDPAIWADPAAPENSKIVITNKVGKLAVHGLDGRTLLELPAGRMNNVDVRPAVSVGGRPRIVVASTNRSTGTIDVFELTPNDGDLLSLLAEPIQPDFEEEVYGLCLYHSVASDRLFAFANDKGGAVEQWQLEENDRGQFTGRKVRRWETGAGTEGCVADDANAWFYVGLENDGIWRYDADPEKAPEPAVVDTTGVEVGVGHLAGDVEGLAIYADQNGDPGAGYLIASSQGNSTYVVYDRTPPHGYRGTFRVVEHGGIDGAEGTDGLDVTSTALGPGYPLGALVVQDGANTNPDGSSSNQNFKVVSWKDVADALGLE